METFTVETKVLIEVEATSLEEAQEFVEDWTSYDYFLGADFVNEPEIESYSPEVVYHGIDPYN